MMPVLCVAIPHEGAERIFKQWDERTAGGWRRHTRVSYLTSDKCSNDGLVSGLAKNAGTMVLASQHLTSVACTRLYRNVQRLKTHQLTEEALKYFENSGLDWRRRAALECAKTPFKCISPDEWVQQFDLVDPTIGRKAAAALLAQFQILGPAELAERFSNLPEVDLHATFYGADPHSGDLALVNILSARVNNVLLGECTKLPKLKPSARVRLYCDGSWSGGETQRRISCLFTSCSKKAGALAATNTLDVHVAVITDAAKATIDAKLTELAASRRVTKGHVRVTFPPGNPLPVTGVHTGQKGLAFQDSTLLKYVDEDLGSLRRLCKKIGEQLVGEGRALGTNGIASCIGFSHSLPGAMLPLFTLGGRKVTGSDGKAFTWRSLVHSEHFSGGVPDQADYHCESCPLADRSQVAVGARGAPSSPGAIAGAT